MTPPGEADGIDGQNQTQLTTSSATSTCCDCLEYHLCCDSSYHDSQIENGSDSCSCSYCISSRKSRIPSASSSGNVESGNANESKISFVNDWNAQNMKKTSFCVFRTLHARNSAIVCVEAQQPRDVVGNET